ncbi:MAG: GAF domain-containing protein [Chloroflexi bacterium]|nr:GAF domain-containing protein [Chloroflexota bacterium]
MTLAEQLPELLSIREAAAALGIHPETLRRWDKQGKLRSRRAGPRGMRRYARQDILRFIQARDEADPIRDAQRLVVDVARAISSSLDLHAVAKTVVDAAARIVGCDRVAIYVMDTTRTMLEPMIGVDVNEPDSVDELFYPNPIPVDAIPLIRYALASPDPVVVADTETHPLSNPAVFRIFNTRTLININLSGPDGEVFGLMPFTWTVKPHAVTQEEVFLAQSLAALAGVALSNARLFAQVEQERSRATVISDVVRGVNSGHNLSDTLNRVSASLVEQLNADEGAIWLTSSDGTSVVGAAETRVHGPSRVGAVMSIRSSPNIARSIELQEPLLVLFEERQGEESRWFETLEVQASLFVPLLAQGTFVGMAFVNYLEAPPILRAMDIRFAGVLGAQCALAIERAQLLEAAYTRAAEVEAIFDAMLDGVIIVDPSGRTIKANAAAAQAVGGNVAAQTLDKRLHNFAGRMPDGKALLRSGTPTARALAGEVVSNMEVVYTDQQGTARSLLISSGPVRDSNGHIRAAVTVSRDITDVVATRRENEALVDSFRRKAAELEAVISQMGEGIVITDRDAQVVLVNHYAEGLYGTADVRVATYGPDTAYQLFAMNGRPLAKEDLLLYRAVHQGETVTNMEWQVRRADSTQVIVNGSATPIIGSQGERLGAVLVLRDVTQRRQIEAEKDQFLSIVSHELKTPLTTIKGLNDLARRKLVRGAQPGEIVQKLEVIAQQVRRMEGLIGDLLDIRRLETGVLPLAFAPLDLTITAREAGERAQAMTERHTISVAADPASGVLVRGDRDRLDQVLDNMLSNAIKYSPDGGLIRLDLCCEGDQALVRIQDQGIGIPAAGRERLFERFYRGSNVVASEYGGLGIGLALSRELVLKHNGSLVLESTSEKGSTFLLRLPLLGENDAPRASEACN